MFLGKPEVTFHRFVAAGLVKQNAARLVLKVLVRNSHEKANSLRRTDRKDPSLVNSAPLENKRFYQSGFWAERINVMQH